MNKLLILLITVISVLQADIKLSAEQKEYLKSNNFFTVCNQYDSYPVTAVKDENLLGVMGDIYKEISKKLNIKFKAIDVNSNEDLNKKVSNDECDFISILATKQKRFSNIKTTVSTHQTRFISIGNLNSFFMDSKFDDNFYKDHTFFVKFKSFKKLINNVHPKLNIVFEEDLDYIFEKVKEDTRFHYISPKIIGEYHLYKYGLKDFKINGVFTTPILHTSLGIHEKHPLMLEIINKTIEELGENFFNNIYFENTIKYHSIEKSHKNLWYFLVIAGIIIVLLVYRSWLISNKNKQIKKFNKKLKEEVSKKTNDLETTNLKLKTAYKEMEVLNTELKDTNKILSFKIKESIDDLEDEKSRYQNFMSLSSDMIFILDMDGELLDYSNQVQEQLGYTDEEMMNLSLFDFDKDITKEENKTIQEHLSNKPITFERVHTRKDGSTYYTEVAAVKLEINGKEIIYASGRDISENKKIREDIEREKIKFSTLFNDSLDAILLLNFKTAKFEDVNPKATSLYGYTKEEFLKLGAIDLDVMHDENRVKEVQENIIKNGWNKFESKHKLKNGSVIDVRVNATVVNLFDKKYIYASIRDISKEKSFQKQLQTQKEEFESIFKYSTDGIAITDLDTNFIDFNDAYQNMTGYTREELLSMSSIGFATKEHKEILKNMIQKVKETGYITNYEKESIVKDKKRVIVNMSISLLPDKKRLLIIIKDITSLKEVESQSRLIAMGEMIGNIAHQWRQPLSAISSSASGIKLMRQLGYSTEENEVKLLDKIVEQTAYLSQTIDDFKNFIKDDKEFKDISIIEVLNSSLSLMEGMLKNSYINVIKNLDDDMTILGNKNEIQQVIINILNNAKDALKENIMDDDDKIIIISTNKKSSSTLELKFIDSAGGIPNTIIEKIFDPYFTTKHQSQGTGLGLSMVDKIIRQRHDFLINVHNTTFEYNNKEYKGACFTITFKERKK